MNIVNNIDSGIEIESIVIDSTTILYLAFIIRNLF